MFNEKRITLRLDAELHRMAKFKCKQYFGIGLTPLIKIFLRSFVTQKGVGFYVGDDDLCDLFARWLSKKGAERYRKGCASLGGPRLKDLYQLGNTDFPKRFNVSSLPR